MSLDIEDGTGRASAESYLSVADAGAYHDAHGNSAWADTDVGDDLREAALRRATRYLDGRYRTRFLGFRTHGRDQKLEWPRQSVYYEEAGVAETGWSYNYGYTALTSIASNEIPRELKDALAEAALRELVSAGSLTPDVTPAQRVQSETVGPISTTYVVSGDAVAAARPTVTVIDEMLAPLLAPSNRYSGSLVRA